MSHSAVRVIVTTNCVWHEKIDTDLLFQLGIISTTSQQLTALYLRLIDDFLNIIVELGTNKK